MPSSARFCLPAGATLLALLIGLPIALYLEVYAPRSRWAGCVRLALDVMWGIPSIVYGAFGFTLMLLLGLRASLLGGHPGADPARAADHDAGDGRGDQDDSGRAEGVGVRAGHDALRGGGSR